MQEAADYAVGFGGWELGIAVAEVGADGLREIGCPAFVREEYALAESPEWGGAELIAGGGS